MNWESEVTVGVGGKQVLKMRANFSTVPVETRRQAGKDRPSINSSSASTL